MNRNILLVEPNYKTKFPPLGLMKISAYHKELGDNVKFVKGISKKAAYHEVWDRIYVSTLFTYHWNITTKTIKYYKKLVHDDASRIFVGGILASLMKKELWEETGIVPITGVLSEPGVFGDDNDLIVENMIPDYKLFDKTEYDLSDKTERGLFDKTEHDLFDKTEYNYTLIDDSYFGYSTRGCVRKCKFCGVRTLEPEFIDYWGIKDYVNGIKASHGEKAHLVLFDNNILASKKIKEIIRDIKELGFEKGSKFSYEKNGQTYQKLRHVDFNQGVDAKLMANWKVKLLSEIALNPLRIAFDHIKDKKIYTSKVRVAEKYGIQNLSNYILYNYDDTPEELWQRLKINIDLNKELGLQIYSFPMKFIPLNAKDRSHIDQPRWNWQFIRGVQRILNVLKGTVMTKEDFFYRAFGENEEEFITILHMPERILMKRGKKPQSKEKEWLKKFNNLTPNEKQELLSILCDNRTEKKLLETATKTKNHNIKKILEFYLPAVPESKYYPLFKNSN